MPRCAPAPLRFCRLCEITCREGFRLALYAGSIPLQSKIQSDRFNIAWYWQINNNRIGERAVQCQLEEDTQ